MTFINMESMNKNAELNFDALNTVNGGQLHFNAQGQRTLCNGKVLTPGEVDGHSAMVEEIMNVYGPEVAAITIDELGFDMVSADFLATHTVEEWAAAQKSKLM